MNTNLFAKYPRERIEEIKKHQEDPEDDELTLKILECDEQAVYVMRSTIDAEGHNPRKYTIQSRKIVKIGYSHAGNLQKRLEDYYNGINPGAKIVTIFPGANHQHELRLHSVFKERKLPGKYKEWFCDCDEIRDLLENTTSYIDLVHLNPRLEEVKYHGSNLGAGKFNKYSKEDLLELMEGYEKACQKGKEGVERYLKKLPDHEIILVTRMKKEDITRLKKTSRGKGFGKEIRDRIENYLFKSLGL